MKHVVLEAIVLWDHTTFGSSSTHLPLRRLNRVFAIAENITLLALSTVPFDSGWWTKVKATLVPVLLQNSLKLSKSNCFLLSTVRVLGTPNLQIMFYQKNFFTISDVIFASGLASIHLMKYSMATTTNLFPPCDGGSGPTRSMPHLCWSQVGGMSCTAAEGFD